MSDVRELVPEFYYLPEMFRNLNKFKFGTTQKGVVIDDVVLPDWSFGDPRLFIKIHREALESEYVRYIKKEFLSLFFVVAIYIIGST